MSILDLFNEANNIDYETSNGMVKVTEMQGPGFFPGCIGTISNAIDFNSCSTIVLGQDFGNEDYYKGIDQSGEIEKSKTWIPMLKLLDTLGIDAASCFFTNAYMGLRNGSTPMTGPCAGSRQSSTSFAIKCGVFFEKQLRTITPKQVLVLGKEPARFVSKIFGQAFLDWSNIRRLQQFYTKEGIHIDHEVDGHMIRFIFVIHPSFNGPNRSKIWGKDNWVEREENLLKKVLLK